MKQVVVSFDGGLPTVTVDGEPVDASVRLTAAPLSRRGEHLEPAVADDITLRIIFRAYRPGGKDEMRAAYEERKRNPLGMLGAFSFPTEQPDDPEEIN